MQLAGQAPQKMRSEMGAGGNRGKNSINTCSAVQSLACLTYKQAPFSSMELQVSMYRIVVWVSFWHITLFCVFIMLVAILIWKIFIDVFTIRKPRNILIFNYYDQGLSYSVSTLFLSGSMACHWFLIDLLSQLRPSSQTWLGLSWNKSCNRPSAIFLDSLLPLLIALLVSSFCYLPVFPKQRL